MLDKYNHHSENISSLQRILGQHRPKRVLMVTGKRSFASSGAKQAILPYLSNFNVEFFSDFNPNPEIEDIKKGVGLVQELQPDMVVAVGGGSVMDIAKSINILAAHGKNCTDLITGKAEIQVKGRSLVAIPTTSGSGSEATQFAVVYVDKKKYSLDHQYLLPDYAITDATLTHNLSPTLTAICGFDALSQGIESFWAVNATSESKRYAAKAIELIIGAIAAAVLNPTPLVRKKMCEGAHFAGKAINISRTTAPHAMSYRLTIDHNIAHGHAVGLTLGKFLLINANSESTEVNDPRGNPYVATTMQALYKLIGGETAKDCSNLLYELMTTIGLETKLETLGIHSESEINNIVDGVNINRLSNNPVKISREMLRSVLQ